MQWAKANKTDTFAMDQSMGFCLCLKINSKQINKSTNKKSRRRRSKEKCITVTL